MLEGQGRRCRKQARREETGFLLAAAQVCHRSLELRQSLCLCSPLPALMAGVGPTPEVLLSHTGPALGVSSLQPPAVGFPCTSATSKSSCRARWEQMEISGRQGSWGNKVPSLVQITTRPGSTGKATALPCQIAVYTINLPMPVANWAFSKHCAHPPTWCACWSLSPFLSLAGGNPFAEEAKPVSSGEVGACTLPAAMVSWQPQAKPSPRRRISCKAVPSLRKHCLGKGAGRHPDGQTMLCSSWIK